MLVSLAACFFYGHGAATNLSRGLELFRTATKAGHQSGQDRLGECYCVGSTVQQDVVRAVNIYRCASDQGSIPAKYKLV